MSSTELAWKSGLKVPLLPLGASCPLQTTLLSDLVGCCSPLQIIMVVWHTFLKILCAPYSFLPLLSGFKLFASGCYTILGGQHSPLKTQYDVFYKGELIARYSLNLDHWLIFKTPFKATWIAEFTRACWKAVFIKVT